MGRNATVQCQLGKKTLAKVFLVEVVVFFNKDFF